MIGRPLSGRPLAGRLVGGGLHATAGVGSALPGWVKGMSLAWDFQNNLKYFGAPDPTDTHAQAIQVEQVNGSFASVSANVLSRSGLGLQTVPTRTNLFASPAAPATQAVTVANGTQYTVSITGPGSITLSGAGTGTVTAGSPVTVTSSTTSLTCTVTGSPTTCTVSAGAFAVPPVLSATVNGNQQYIDFSSDQLDGGFSLIMQVDYRTAQLGTAPRTFACYNAAAGNDQDVVRLNYTGSSMSLNVSTANVNQASLTVSGTAAALVGVQNVAISAGTDYANARFVGQSAVSPDTAGTFPTNLNRMALMGRGYDTACNGYGFVRKMAIKYGAQNDTTFAAAFAAAQIMSAS